MQSTRRLLMEKIDVLQNALNFSGCRSNKQFVGNGIGKIGTTGFALGLLMGAHFSFVLSTIFISSYVDVSKMMLGFCVTLCHWSLYVTLLCAFHFGEFFVTALKQPASLSYDSFIVNHSASYTIAALLSWLEYWLESAIFGGGKHNIYIVAVGFIIVIFGQIIRTLGMITCGENFSHTIMESKKRDHQLVTQGIYTFLRHPAYTGWFYWAVGTQVLLCNPICAFLYAYASWRFFSARIPYEEDLLNEFYPEKYSAYASRTYIMIPFVKSKLKHI